MSRRRHLTLSALLLLSAASAQAQYKVIGSDGRVTYTDRPPVETTSRVQTLDLRRGTPATGDGLPYALQQPAARFPVTLYKEQWWKLLDMADDVRAFISENEEKLKSKE